MSSPAVETKDAPREVRGAAMRCLSYVVLLVLGLGVLGGGVFWCCFGSRSVPSYVVLEAPQGKRYPLIATDARALYERLQLIQQQLKKRYAECGDEFICVSWPELQAPGDLNVAIYDEQHRLMGSARLCKYLPFTVFEPLAPLTSVRDCIAEKEQGLFYQNQSEWYREKELIYEALQDKEIALVRYLVALKYHRNRNMQSPSPVDYALRLQFDEAIPLLDSKIMDREEVFNMVTRTYNLSPEGYEIGYEHPVYRVRPVIAPEQLGGGLSLKVNPYTGEVVEEAFSE